MNRRKIMITAALLLVGLPTFLILALYGYFYSVFYFPNWTAATAQTIVVAGETRTYLLYVPKSYDASRPTSLVITLHSSMSWPASIMKVSQWNQLADEQGFVVAYPAGTGFGSRSWEMAGSETPSRMPDVLFISALIDRIEASYSIDRTRIYANGMSNGGGMAFVLSCTLWERIAAVGLVSAGVDPGWSWCGEKRQMPLIGFHGAADPIVPYGGGPPVIGAGMFPSIPLFVRRWAARNECSKGPVESAVATDVVRTRYMGCHAGSDVELYTIRGEGHQWPGGRPVPAQWMLGRYSRSIEATRLMWEFFRAHPKNAIATGGVRG